MGVRYRTGIDARSGRLVTGWPHVVQSVGKILTTALGERVMRLDVGADLQSHIGRALVAETVLRIYRDAVAAIHRWEPEYRVARLRLVAVERTGGVQLLTEGDYYPEGRLGNYRIVEVAAGAFALVAGEALAVGAAP